MEHAGLVDVGRPASGQGLLALPGLRPALEPTIPTPRRSVAGGAGLAGMDDPVGGAGIVVASALGCRRMSDWLHLVVTRAVALAILLGPSVIVGALRLATTDVNTIVEDPGDIVLVSVVLLAGVGVLVLAASVFGQEYDLGTGRVLLT